MQKKSEDFSMQEAMRIAKSPAGQQLLAMLRQSGSGQQAMEQVNAGDYEKASQTLRQLLSTPEAQKLLGELRR